MWLASSRSGVELQAAENGGGGCRNKWCRKTSRLSLFVGAHAWKYEYICINKLRALLKPFGHEKKRAEKRSGGYSIGRHTKQAARGLAYRRDEARGCMRAKCNGRICTTRRQYDDIPPCTAARSSNRLVPGLFTGHGHLTPADRVKTF